MHEIVTNMLRINIYNLKFIVKDNSVRLISFILDMGPTILRLSDPHVISNIKEGSLITLSFTANLV